MLPLIPTQVIIFTLLLAWLGACVVYDLRSRRVPVLLTVPPLALAALWRLLQGGWVMILLVAALIFVSDLPSARWRILLSCLVSTLGIFFSSSPESIYGLLVIFAAWSLWQIGATGGADAKIIITLVLLFASGLLFIPIVLAGGAQGLIGLIARKKTIPYTVAITLGTAAWLWLSAGR